MRYLIYDANCPMCLSSVERLRRLRLDDKITPLPNTDFDFGESLNARVQELVGLEMQLVDPETGVITSGFDVLLAICSEVRSLAWLVPLFRLPGIYSVLRFLYRTVAYNRKTITPPKPQPIECACPPAKPTPLVYRLAFWLPCLLLVVLNSVFLLMLSPGSPVFLMSILALLGFHLLFALLLGLFRQARFMLLFLQQAAFLYVLSSTLFIVLLFCMSGLSVLALQFVQTQQQWIVINISAALSSFILTCLFFGGFTIAQVRRNKAIQMPRAFLRIYNVVATVILSLVLGMHLISIMKLISPGSV